MKHKKVKPISKDKRGEIIFNLSADAANADWIRAARLKEQGKLKELKKLLDTPMVQIVQDGQNKQNDEKSSRVH